MREYLVYRYSESPTYWGPWGEKRQTACKPGSVAGLTARAMAIHLGRPSPGASRDRPGQPVRKPTWKRSCDRPRAAPTWSCSRRGLPCRPRCRGARCALTAPFHPCSPALRLGASGLLSVALSLGSPPPGVTRLRASVEPGLSSAAHLRRRRRPSGRLARPDYARARTRSSPSQDCPNASACTWPMTAAVPASISPSTQAWRKCR